MLRPALTGPTMPTGRFGDVPAVDAVATHDEQTGALTVFVVNRGTEPVPLTVDLRAFPRHRIRQHLTLTSDRPVPVETEIVLPPVSWHALCLTPEES